MPRRGSIQQTAADPRKDQERGVRWLGSGIRRGRYRAPRGRYRYPPARDRKQEIDLPPRYAHVTNNKTRFSKEEG